MTHVLRAQSTIIKPYKSGNFLLSLNNLLIVTIMIAPRYTLYLTQLYFIYKSSINDWKTKPKKYAIIAWLRKLSIMEISCITWNKMKRNIRHPVNDIGNLLTTMKRVKIVDLYYWQRMSSFKTKIASKTRQWRLKRLHILDNSANVITILKTLRKTMICCFVSLVHKYNQQIERED